MSEEQAYLRATLVDVMVEGANKLNTPIHSRRGIEKIVSKMSDYEVDQIWAEAFYYYRQEKDQHHEEPASQPDR